MSAVVLHVNLCVAVITVALCCILLRSHIPASSLPSLPLGRLLYTESAAFVCLVGPSSHSRNRTRGLQLMLQTLQINYQAIHKPRPVILFFANDVPPEQYTPEIIRGVVPAGMAGLVEVVVLPKFTDLPTNMRTVVLHSIIRNSSFPGYQNMCRWNLWGMMQHPRIARLQYYARLDTDSRVLGPIDVDLFETMADRGLHYGYAITEGEVPAVAVGMWRFANDYVNTHFKKPDKERAKRNHFYGNLTIGQAEKERFMMIKNEFEVVHVPRFQQPDIVQFTDAVDATHMMYSARWGDSPLRWLECLLFLDMEREVYHFDFDYGQDRNNEWQPDAQTGTT